MKAADGTELTPEERRTFRLHLFHALFEALAGGILTNATLMGTKALGAKDWQLMLPMAVSSIGMFAAWGSGQWMARRDKRPFILWPFALQAVCALAMACLSAPAAFLLLAGAATLFEMTVRPAMGAFFRQSYPAALRGRISGVIRGWCSVAFLVSNLASATALQYGRGWMQWIMPQMVLAAVFLVLCLMCIAAVRIREAEGKVEVPVPGGSSGTSSLGILKNDPRFRIYLVGAFIFLIGGLLYIQLLPAVLSKDYGLNYVHCALLLHVGPSLIAFAATQLLGPVVDRVNPLRLWGFIRCGWGLDPLLLVLGIVLAPFQALSLSLAITGRALRGATMGTSYALWWMVGVAYFAPPGAGTSRYMGIQTFLNGLARLAAAGISAWLLTGLSRSAVLGIGGTLVLLSALHAWWQAAHDPGGAGSLSAQDSRFRQP